MVYDWSLGNLPRGSLKKALGDLPGDPVAKTPSSQCRGPVFSPESGN